MIASPTLRRAAAALVVALLPAAGRGEEALGVLPVADAPGPGPELVTGAAELHAALAARAPGVLAPEALRQRMTGSAPPAALAELDRAYAGALAAHAAGEYEPSNRTLRSVVAALETLPEGPAVHTAWTRAMLRLARSEQELGRAVEAQAVLERLLRAAPDVRADPRQYPPSFQALVDEARARLRALGTRHLTVESHPEARVFVEGREVGTTPVSLELPPGRYRVAGLRGGIRAPAALVELAEDRTVQLDMSLADALRPDAGPGLAIPEARRPARVLTAAARLALDRAVVVSELRNAEGGFLVATLLDVRRGVAEREARVALAEGGAGPGALDALAAFLVLGEHSPLVEVVQDRSLEVAPEAADKVLGGAQVRSGPARRSRALGWTAVGAGAAALAAGTATALLAWGAQSNYDHARSMLDGSGRVAAGRSVADYNAALATGDRRRDLAVATGVVAGASAATAAVLSYVSWRRTGEIGPFRF